MDRECSMYGREKEFIKASDGKAGKKETTGKI
jgi:hypothetical protein